MLRAMRSLIIVLVALGFGAGRTIGAGEIEVVASIKPVHSLVAGVMEGVGAPALLVKGASSPHDYSMRPSDARALAGAQVVFWVGEGLETFLTKPLAALAADATIVALSEAPGVELLPTREGGLWREHELGEADPDAHAEHEEPGDEDHEQIRKAAAARDQRQQRAGPEDEHGHAPGEFDMHLWLDPRSAEAMVGAVVAALSKADPENAATYQGNGRALRSELQELDVSLSARLAPVRDRPFVVFHDAYQYLENRYALNAVGAITVDPRRRPGARRLAEIQQRLAELDVACVFFEPQFEPALVDTVIEGTSAKKGVLDPLGADLDPGADQYLQLMGALAAAVIDCLGAARPG
jgi:zinc transport system substrate-binding protein